MLGLLRLHGDVVEADLQRHYQVDLADLWRGTLTLRRLRVLIEGLPADSNTAYAMAGEQLAHLKGWGFTELLMARLVDEISIYRWQWESAHLDPKKSRPRKAPPSVLPGLPSTGAAGPFGTPDRDNVVALVSPHRLGGFVNDTDD